MKSFPPVKKSAKLIIIGVLSTLLLLFIIIPPAIIYSGKFKIYPSIDDVQKTEIGIVFGAGVTSDHEPTLMLRDRLLTTIELYENGKISKIIVSGDNRVSNYNEPEVMHDFLVDNGIPKDSIFQDFAGRRTYDTCWRAREIFGVEKALLITQGYHLPRALYLCNTFGIESTGFSATKDTYPGDTFYKVREIAALYRSFLDVVLIKPTPVQGEKIEI